MTPELSYSDGTADLPSLLELEVLALRIVVRFRTEARLPPFKSSTFRGVLGVALKQEACAHKDRPECSGCPLRSECVYPWLFEGACLRPNPDYQQSATSPPLRILVEDQRREVYPAGSRLDLRVVLFGSACTQAGFVIHCLDLAGRELGVGKGQRQGQGRFERLRVVDGESDTVLCTDHGLPGATRGTSLVSHRAPLADSSVRRIELHSPLQYKHNSREWTSPATQPSLAALLGSLQHRLYLLNWHFRPGFALAPPEPVQCTSTLLDHGLRWMELNRFSNRSAELKPISGMTGWLCYRCHGRTWDDLLSVARLVGLGRQTVMGLGDIRVLDY